METLGTIRRRIRAADIANETTIVNALIQQAQLNVRTRQRISRRAVQLVEDIRSASKPGLMEVFLAEYGLSTDEGVALMCLAEALLRVPDAETIDSLIEDKIAPSSWGAHLGQSSSSLVNASTWALMLTGRVLDEDSSTGIARVLHGAVKRLGEPVIRMAVKRALQQLGNQFVLGETIESAIERGAGIEKQGYTYSYDMLGEAALTAKDAACFFDAYHAAIGRLAGHCHASKIRNNPGISIKLSALHPRYEVGQAHRVMAELVERVVALAGRAKQANMGLNIDSEEADRLDLSLDVIEAALRHPLLAGWDGFGVVVQAYGKRASFVLDWLYRLASELDRKLMVRLVKGAYWDTEIKRAQVLGMEDFPVFSRKAATDVSYICCAQKLLRMTDRIYPQFATHNAHSVAAILELATDRAAFEFQRLHGMGEALHSAVKNREHTQCRIYAPVGAHRDLLAYLVRRLLENGANSSFVNQIVDKSIPAEEIAADPLDGLFDALRTGTAAMCRPIDLYAPERPNARGWDLSRHEDLDEIDGARGQFRVFQWQAGPIMVPPIAGKTSRPIVNPADPTDIVGYIREATPSDAEAAVAASRDWRDCPAGERARVLNGAADLYQARFGELFAALAREAGKTPADAIAELREAVDFLRYYAARVSNHDNRPARGCFVCISPWNFPLAIFTGQIGAALAAGNGVLAKPADQTPLTASIATRLLHQAGVPRDVLQLVPGSGATVGARLVSDPRINGVCFTGSTATAQLVNRAMAANAPPDAPLIAETGGLNAMLVDSTALPEQAVKDIVVSAFQSAGQRCSALRVLYLQEDVSTFVCEMLFGAMDELVLGDPWHYVTDVGPVIDAAARTKIVQHVEAARRDGRLLKQLSAPGTGNFVAPAVIRLESINDLETEIFGPVLHVATFKASEIDHVVDDINRSGYGLTFGMHTRIDDRVEHLTSRLHVGNMYVNRNQIGAIVGSQPFGGEGLSGTGPKAGGPGYVPAFTRSEKREDEVVTGPVLDFDVVQAALNSLEVPAAARLRTIDLPGPTGESNRLSAYPRGVVLCLGPTVEAAEGQARLARSQGCSSLMAVPGASGPGSIDGFVERAALARLDGFDMVGLSSNDADVRHAKQALASRQGRLIPLLSGQDLLERCVLERHICIDTTAAGGNASLLAASA